MKRGVDLALIVSRTREPVTLAINGLDSHETSCGIDEKGHAADHVN